MSMDRLNVSVIIPTHNRSAILQRTLDALRTQTYSRQQMEVIVVADGCIDGTMEMLRHYRAPFPLHVIEQSGKGPAVARNRGAARATGRLLIFLDDDIEPSPSLIEVHADAHRRWPGHVVIGYSLPVLDGRIDLFSIELRGWWEKMFRTMRQPGHRYTYRDLLSGNLSLEAELFARVGGFDPTFWCHEDYELGVRLIKIGSPFIFVADALGYHHQTTDLNVSLQRKYQEGIADVIMGSRHPELLSTLPLASFEGPFWFPRRLLSTLAFSWPATGKVLDAGLRHLLDLLEVARLRRPWRLLLGALLTYSYWQGVAEKLSTQRALADFLKDGLAHPDESGPEIEIDLREGLEAAERLLDKIRPAGTRIRYGQQPVGQVPPQPGAERLRGAHLRPILATDLAKPLLKALTLEEAIDVDIDANRLLAVCS